MTQLLYRTDKNKAYGSSDPSQRKAVRRSEVFYACDRTLAVNVLPRQSTGWLLITKSGNRLGEFLETKKLGSEILKQSRGSYWKPSLFSKGYASYGGTVWPRVRARVVDDYTIVYLKESPLKKAVSGSTRLTGPIQFLAGLLETWRLEPESAVLLLGQEPSYDVGKLLRGDAQLSGRDTKDRMACLFRIRKTLSSLFRDKDIENEWLQERHKPLGGQTPMEMLLEGSMENMLTVKEYVDWTAGR